MRTLLGTLLCMLIVSCTTYRMPLKVVRVDNSGGSCSLTLQEDGGTQDTFYTPYQPGNCSYQIGQEIK